MKNLIILAGSVLLGYIMLHEAIESFTLQYGHQLWYFHLRRFQLANLKDRASSPLTELLSLLSFLANGSSI